MSVASLFPTYVICTSDGGELGSVGKHDWKNNISAVYNFSHSMSNICNRSIHLVETLTLITLQEITYSIRLFVQLFQKRVQLQFLLTHTQ